MNLLHARLGILTVIIFFIVTGCSERSGRVSTPSQDSSETQLEGKSYPTPGRRPNILLILADDLGFNDLGVFGSEIHTPVIDSLANEGVSFTRFYAAPACSPTRAMLLSGTDNHIAGLGNMMEVMADNQRGHPGYEGYLNYNVAVLPEILRDAGYHTYMTGKWHLGLAPETGPRARGFQKSFALLQGGAGAFANMLPVLGPGKAIYQEDGQPVDSLPEDFYSTAFYTDRMIEYIGSNLQDNKPFFAYLAYTSPHWPLQAPTESIARYDGVYDDGFDAIQEKRLQALKDLGLVNTDVQAYPKLAGEQAWDSLTPEQQRYQAKVMQIYAAMVDDMDRYLDKLITYLKSVDAYENTVIFFMSDNGPEGNDLDRDWDLLARWVEACCDNSYENIGRANSYVWYGPNWGQAGSTPLRMFKRFTFEGGIRVPAFIHFPKGLRTQGRNDAMLTVMDVMPTLLDLAQVEYPGSKFRGRDVAAMQGHSMLPMLQGDSVHVHSADQVFGWELFGKRAIRQGEWKIVYQPHNDYREGRIENVVTDTWQLYNLADDPSELNELSSTHPEKLEELKALWEDYAARNNVIIPQ